MSLQKSLKNSRQTDARDKTLHTNLHGTPRTTLRSNTVKNVNDYQFESVKQ